MALTTDPNDPRLGYGSNTEPVEQNEAYLVLPQEEVAAFVRPVRTQYKHLKCGAVTTMHEQIAETYARDPAFYGSTYCSTCRLHRPVGKDGEFTWLDGEPVGT